MDARTGAIVSLGGVVRPIELANLAAIGPIVLLVESTTDVSRLVGGGERHSNSPINSRSRFELANSWN